MEVFILSGARTPFGSFRKALAALPATSLGATAIREAVRRSGLPASAVTEVYMGNVCPAGLKQAPARQAALGAGLLESTICTTVNKVCASGLKSAMLAAQSLTLGHNDVMVAGGMENMSQVPFYLDRRDPTYGGVRLQDGIVHDGLTDAYSGDHMGSCTERLAARMGINRKDQDEYAASSYQRAQAAARDGLFKAELVPVTIKDAKKGDKLVEADEEYARTDVSRFPSLRPAFQKDGTITAANASTLNDGAAAMVLVNQRGLDKAGAVKPLARVVGYADAETTPADFGIAPALAIPKLLAVCGGLSVDDVAAWEINEAFSAVALACQRSLGIPADRLNPHGGAVAIGHPIGASGARILLHLAYSLRQGERGVAAICNGGGGASAMMIQRL